VALVTGFAYGGLRILAQRFFPNRVFGQRADIIRLDLER
jgi:hypothetical protein